MISKPEQLLFSIKETPITLSLFFITIILSFAIQSPASLSAGVLILILFVAINYKLKRTDFLWITSIFLICLPPIASLNHGFSPLLYFFLFISSLLASKHIAKLDLAIIKKSLSYTYVIFTSTALCAYIINIDSPEPFEGLIPGTSTNGITSYLIILQTTYSLFHYFEKGYFPLESSLLTLFIAILGIGRGSIYAALMIFTLSAIFNIYLFAKKQKIKKIALFLLIFSLFFTLLIINYDFLFNYIASGTKALQGFEDSARMSILMEYMHNLNSISLFTGQSFENSLIDNKYDGNPHIAFIRTHAYMGILVIPLMFSPLCIFFSKRKLTEKLFVLSFTLIALFRALSEPIIFPTLLDLFYFLPLFYLNKKNKKPRTLKHEKREHNL